MAPCCGTEENFIRPHIERTFVNHHCGQIKWARKLATPDSCIVMKRQNICKLINLIKCVYRLFYCVKHANINVIKTLMNNVKINFCHICGMILHLPHTRYLHYIGSYFILLL